MALISERATFSLPPDVSMVQPSVVTEEILPLNTLPLYKLIDSWQWVFKRRSYLEPPVKNAYADTLLESGLPVIFGLSKRPDNRSVDAFVLLILISLPLRIAIASDANNAPTLAGTFPCNSPGAAELPGVKVTASAKAGNAVRFN